MASERNTPIAYMPQLDGLRCIAVCLVMFNHFIPESWPIYHLFPFGTAGVHLFYVLSGFLITGILLKALKESESNLQGSKARILRAFYIRRTLRIFPVYYLTVLLLYAFDSGPTREHIWWCLTYTSNFLFAREGSFLLPLSHFWSLAVEEQFYLLWPCLLLFLPGRRLRLLALVAIFLAPVFRILCFFMEWGRVASLVLLPGCLDLLCLGSLLAINPKTSIASKRAMQIALLVFVFLQVYYLLSAGNPLIYLESFRYTALGVVWLYLVARASSGFSGAVGKFLEHPAAVYLGKISYGLYLFNRIVSWLLAPYISALGFSEPLEVLLRFLVFGSGTIFLAAISWRYFEEPLNSLKRNFQYTPIENKEERLDF